MPLSRAHNLAAAAARASLLARLDADDIALPERLAMQVRMLQGDPGLVLVGTAVELIDGGQQVLSTIVNPATDAQIRAAMRVSCPLVHSTVMVRADPFRRAGCYREGLNISEDYDLYARLLSQVLVQYRVHAASLTSTRPLRMAIGNLTVQAAVAARAQGVAEPFIDGTPSLRRAAALLGLGREDLRLRLRASAWQARISRAVLVVAVPLRLNVLARRVALRAGLRPLYTVAFRTAARAGRMLGRA
jgi:hypothetical protein